MEGWNHRQEPPRKVGEILARSKWQGEGFGDVTVTPREALYHHPHGPSAGRYGKTWPKAFKTPGFPNLL